MASVGQAIAAVTDHVSGADIIRATQRSEEQAKERMSARIQALRTGFSNIRQRHEALSERMARSRRTA
jgi:hypothetical protein